MLSTKHLVWILDVDNLCTAELLEYLGPLLIVVSENSWSTSAMELPSVRLHHIALLLASRIQFHSRFILALLGSLVFPEFKLKLYRLHGSFVPGTVGPFPSQGVVPYYCLTILITNPEVEHGPRTEDFLIKKTDVTWPGLFSGGTTMT